jgi:hypothetical protein
VLQHGPAAPLATVLLRGIAQRYVRMEAEGLKARSESIR